MNFDGFLGTHLHIQLKQIHQNTVMMAQNLLLQRQISHVNYVGIFVNREAIMKNWHGLRHSITTNTITVFLVLFKSISFTGKYNLKKI